MTRRDTTRRTRSGSFTHCSSRSLGLTGSLRGAASLGTRAVRHRPLIAAMQHHGKTPGVGQVEQHVAATPAPPALYAPAAAW